MLGFKKKSYNVAVIGEKGMLGKEVCSWLRTESRRAGSKIGNVWTIEKNDVDFSKPTQSTLTYFFNNKVLNTPDIVVNCAAYTDTTAIETTVEGRLKSYQENVVLPATLAEACAKAKIKLIHISTDYVSSEYSKDINIPANIYGTHKLLAEKMVKEAYSKYSSTNYLILRTSWLFGPNDLHKTFIEKFMLNMYKKIAVATLENKDRIEVPVASNTCGFPTSTWFLSSFIRNAISVDLRGTTYAYQPTSVVGCNFPHIEAVSRYDWAVAIAAVVCSYRNFNANKNFEIVKKIFDVPKTIDAVHHPQDLLLTDISLDDITNEEPLISPKDYDKCMKGTSSWKLHTEYFIERKDNFEKLEEWIFSSLKDDERKAIESYQLLDKSPIFDSP